MHRVRLRLLLAVLLTAGVLWADLARTPTYEATAEVLVGWDQALELKPRGQAMVHSIADSGRVAEEAIRRLGLEMTPAELLDNLTVEQIEGTNFVALTYEDANPVLATRVVNTTSEVLSELASARDEHVIVHETAIVPERPVSPKPLRDGLVTLTVGLIFAFTRPLRIIRRRPPSEDHERRVMSIEDIKEKTILEALGRRGKLTALQAAVETWLTVEEAERMLQALALQGQLEVTVEDGKLLYSFWGYEAP